MRVFTAFLEPGGRVSHFYIPFHALSITSTAEKDINVRARIAELLRARPELCVEEIFKLLDEVRSLQLRLVTVLQLFGGEAEGLAAAEGLELVERLIQAAPTADKKAQSLEQKLYLSRLAKLRQIIRLYSSVAEAMDVDATETEPSLEDLSMALTAPVTDLGPIFKLILDHKPKDENVTVLCSDFIQCFETEGELSSGDRTGIRLRKDISPRIQQQLFQLFCRMSTGEGARERFAESGISPGEILETVLNSFLRNPTYTVSSLSSLHHCFLILLGLREGSDDKTISSLQDIAKRILLKNPISSDLQTLIFMWSNSLSLVRSPPSYVEEWTRRLHQVSGFLGILQTFRELSKEELNHRYTLNDVFDNGNGRIAEIVVKLLVKLGSNSLNLAGSIDGFTESAELALVSKCAEFYPRSMDPNVLVVHMCWEELQRWQRGRDDLQLLETALMGLTSISCPSLKIRFSNLVWRSFFAKLFRDLAKRTDDFRKTTINEAAVCEKELGLRRESLGPLLGLLLNLLERILDLAKFEVTAEAIAEYDSLSLAKQLHLLDHVKATGLPDVDILSLEHQVASVLYLTWTLKLPARPLKLFNSVEINNLLSIQSTAVVSWFSDYNAGVKAERAAWAALVTEAAAGHIHRLPNGRLDTDDYRTYVEVVLQLGRVWFMSDAVRVLQCCALYKAGFDSLGAELRNASTEREKLAHELLEVALLRLAKYLTQVQFATKLTIVFLYKLPSRVDQKRVKKRTVLGTVQRTLRSCYSPREREEKTRRV